MVAMSYPSFFLTSLKFKLANENERILRAAVVYVEYIYRLQSSPVLYRMGYYLPYSTVRYSITFLFL